TGDCPDAEPPVGAGCKDREAPGVAAVEAFGDASEAAAEGATGDSSDIEPWLGAGCNGGEAPGVAGVDALPDASGCLTLLKQLRTVDHRRRARAQDTLRRTGAVQRRRLIGKATAPSSS